MTTLHIDIPEGLDEVTVHELDQAAREAIAVRLYQQGKLSHGKLAKFLGIGRGQVDDLLGRYHVVNEFSAQEVAEQAVMLNQLRRQER